MKQQGKGRNKSHNIPQQYKERNIHSIDSDRVEEEGEGEKKRRREERGREGKRRVVRSVSWVMNAMVTNQVSMSNGVHDATQTMF